MDGAAVALRAPSAPPTSTTCSNRGFIQISIVLAELDTHNSPNDVLLSPGLSLQILRRRLPALVRTLRWCYGLVRLLGDVRAGPAACACSHRPAARSRASPRSPGSRAGSFLTCTGSPTAPGSPAACESATVDMAIPFCPQGRHAKRVFRGSLGGPPVPLKQRAAAGHQKPANGQLCLNYLSHPRGQVQGKLKVRRRSAVLFRVGIIFST